MPLRIETLRSPSPWGASILDVERGIADESRAWRDVGVQVAHQRLPMTVVQTVHPTT